MAELKDWLSAAAILVSAIIAVGGWLTNAWLTRRHHIFQKRLEKRLEMHAEVFRLLEAITAIANSDPDKGGFEQKYPELMRSAALSGHLFGYPDEQRAFSAFQNALNAKDGLAVNSTHNNVVLLIGDRIKRDLGFSCKQREIIDPEI